VIRHRKVEAIIEAGDGDNDELVVRSPGVGLYGYAPRVGEILVGRGRAGRLTTLGLTVELVLPADQGGRVAERVLVDRLQPVEYGQVLLRLVPVEAAEVAEGVVGSAGADTNGLAEGTFAIRSPSHGMFYRRPGVDEPAYVEVGDEVGEGATLALVEVMKCFSTIHYGGDGLPAKARVLEVRADDASEVEADQVLFVVEPA